MATHKIPAPPRREPKPERRQAPSTPTTTHIPHQHRERDFGIGYGNSSGYGTEEHYVHPWGPDRFRCV